MAGYVLIVESDAELQRRIGDALREARYELASEAESAWAKRTIAVRAPDAFVIDTHLPDGDGFSLAEELRRNPETRAAPILFVASTHRGASHRAEARRRFAPAEYLPLPLDTQNLVRLLGQGLATAAARPAHDALDEAPGPPPAVAPLVTALDGVLRDPEQRRERRSVERTAKTLAHEKAELQGTLRRMPFARLLQRLYAQKATGALLLLRDASKKDATKKIISFVDGYPVSVKSNVLAECLGQILLDRRLITERALTDSVARMQAEKRQQGQILVEMGALSPYNLQLALVEQIEAKLFEVFAWPDGKFMFKHGDEPASREAQRLDRPPAALILEGIRRHYDDARQRTVLETYAGRSVALNPNPLLRLQDVTADPHELAFIRSIDGTDSAETLWARAPIPHDKARLLLVALSEAGMIRPSDPPTLRRRTTLQNLAMTPTPGLTGAPPPAGGLGGVAPQQASGPLTTGQLSMVAETARSQDYFWTLGLERGASAGEVDRAYDAQARIFHADRYRNSSEEDRKIAQEVFERLSEAHRVLRDPARRRAYIGKLDRTVDRPVERGERQPDASGSIEPSPNAASNAAARSLYEAGIEHLRARRHHEAVEAFRQAARLVPNEADYRAALGWALFREAPADARAGRAALAELRRALQLDVRSRKAVEYLAQIYAQTGQPELAIQELERLLTIDPAATDAADELRRLRQER
jgi:DNA-binding response OmpR family regulator/curved DNA-binding protein CbpA